MTTHLDYTVSCIVESGHQISDVVFIGSLQSGHSCTWEEFVELTNEPIVGLKGFPTDLVIGFSDQSYLKEQYNGGGTCWALVPPLKIPVEKKPIKSLITSHAWRTLAELDPQLT